MKYLLLSLLLLTPVTAHAQVGELFDQKCAKCHGPELAKAKGKFVVSQGSKEKDRILQAVLNDEMPPNKPLTEAEKEIVSRWANPPATAPPQKTKEAPLTQRAITFVGKFHILALYFPIALIIIIIYLEFAWWLDMRYRSEESAGFIRLVVRLCALSACVSVGLGWIHGISRDSPGLYLHGYLGTAAALLCVGLDWSVNRKRDWLYYTVLALATAVMVASAHSGASLVHGERFLAW